MQLLDQQEPLARYIFEPSFGDSSISKIGAKGLRLSELACHNLPVPKFYCITTCGFDAWIEQSATYRKLCKSSIQINLDSAGVIAKELTGIKLPGALERAVIDEFDKLFTEDDKVSVRSSAIDEDSPDDSYAGLLSSVLYVPRERLTESVVECYFSAISPKVIAYRSAKGKSFTDISCAVVVQKMIDADKSGIAFSANPLNNNREEIIITGGYGIGEGVVSNKVPSDTFFLNKTDFDVICSNISLKCEQLVFNKKENIGTLLCDVDKDKCKQELLNNKQLNQLGKLICMIEKHFNYPQDIEWALTNSNCFYILQSRPITTLTRGERRILDNSNIKENYPGTLLPLSFSYTRWVYSIAIRKVNMELGATRHQLIENAELFNNFVCLIKGHIYYNMSNWYKIYALLPGFEKYIPVFERTFSMKSDSSLNKVFQKKKDIFKKTIHKSYVIFRIIYNYGFFNKKARDFHNNFSYVKRHYKKHNLKSASIDELVDLIDTVTINTLKKSGITLVNDFFTFIFFHFLENLISRIDKEESNTTLNDLLLHESNMDSVDNVKSIIALTRLVHSDIELKALFNSKQSAENIIRYIKNCEKHESFKTLFDLHIEEYGDRSTEELKLESTTIRNRPELLIEYIRSYLNSDFSYFDIAERNREQRKFAEVAIRNKLKSISQRILFTWYLHGARRGVRERENFRFARTRLFGMVRSIAYEIGRRFTRHGVLNDPSDIHYLSLDEIKYFVRTGDYLQDFRKAVDERKHIYTQEYKSLQLPERITTYGPIGLINIEPALPVNTATNQTLTGLGCATGIIRAPALVVPDPKQAVNAEGKILVARMTDPGWIFLMLNAKGLVVENGNILSHTAIIGRELGIPTIVGVEDAMSHIHDGNVLEINGSLGTVRLIS